MGSNRSPLTCHHLLVTASTGRFLREQLRLPEDGLRTGPFGGSQQIETRIADGQIDPLIFWSPLEPPLA